LIQITERIARTVSKVRMRPAHPHRRSGDIDLRGIEAHGIQARVITVLRQ